MERRNTLIRRGKLSDLQPRSMALDADGTALDYTASGPVGTFRNFGTLTKSAGTNQTRCQWISDDQSRDR